MSGILGQLHLGGGATDSAQQAAMASSLATLGPDGYSEAGTTAVRLGHLSKRRERGEHQSCQALSCGHGLYLTADLRLDNRSELVARLGLDGNSAGHSGSEILAAAYRRWGVDCARELLGDFAFAIWDERRRRLLMARDHFGIRPLFYCRKGASFYFASALRGLLALHATPPELNERMLARYLIFSSSNSGETLYEGIHSLVPRHTLVIEGAAQPRIAPYWQPDPHHRVRFSDETEYVERYRELLTRAVRSRLAGSRRPAVMVSGGLDSSTLAALAARDHGGPVVGLAHVVEPGAPEVPTDERRFLVDLERHVPNLDIRFVTAAGVSPLEGTVRAYEVLGEPIQAGLDYVQKALLQAAAEEGTDVVLMGAGGDEIVSASCPGYAFGLLRSLRWSRLAREIRAKRERPTYSARDFWIRALLTQIPRPLWHGLNRWRHGYFGGYSTALREDVARRHRLRKELNRSSFWDLSGYLQPDTRRMLFETVLWMCDEGVDLHGWVTEAAEFDQEMRYPMADLRLVEYCMAVPPDQHRSEDVGRRLIRAATEGLLPESIRGRLDKVPFGPDYAERVRRDLARLRTAFSSFESRPGPSRLIDFRSLDAALERVGDPGTGPARLAEDCLQVVLPAFYLGSFLELYDSGLGFEDSGDRVGRSVECVAGRPRLLGDGNDRLLA